MKKLYDFLDWMHTLSFLQELGVMFTIVLILLAIPLIPIIIFVEGPRHEAEMQFRRACAEKGGLVVAGKTWYTKTGQHFGDYMCIEGKVL